MIHIVYSHGRCGSTLFAQILAASIYSKESNNPRAKDFNSVMYIHHDMNSNVELLQNQRIIHTHRMDKRYNNLSRNNKMYFLTRRNIVETIASLMIAQHTKGYNFVPGEKNTKMNTKKYWKRPPSSKLALSDTRIQTLVESYNFFISNEHLTWKRRNRDNTHLVFYEDWISDFSKLPFEDNYNYDLNYKLTNKIPIDKLEWVDYGLLTSQVKRFNNGSIHLQMK